jgi:non-ribosomal peptide synthetase component F
MILVKHTKQVNSSLILTIQYVIWIVSTNTFYSSFFYTCVISATFCLDAIIEQQMPMTGASMFWHDSLHDCNIDQSLSLPFDRYRLSNQHRTGRGTSVSFHFDQHLSHDFLLYSLSNNIKCQHLALTIYYVFLFKLTNGTTDLCIGINTNGRYKDELKSIIGMFVNAIPLRCQLNPHWSFSQLMNDICEMETNSMKYSYFPLQRILAQHRNASQPAFLDTSFEFQSIEIMNRNNEGLINKFDFCLVSYPTQISTDEFVSKFDFALTIQHDIIMNQLSCTIDASLDLFDQMTTQKMLQRFHSLLKQLFSPMNDQMNKSIYELSLILSDERLLMKSMNNTEIFVPSLSCIHHEFVSQVMKYPQKLAVELDDQSLTYCELLYYVQSLSVNLLNQYEINPGEIICQCVERSLSMVS